MSAKDLALAHGDKAIVAVTVLLCGWSLWRTAEDPGIRPGNNITAQIMANDIELVEEVGRTASPPILKEPFSYLAKMKDEMAKDLPARSFSAWLTTQPDLRSGVAQGTPVYVYELLEPSLSAKDAVGRVELTIDLPSSVRAADKDRRLTDAPRAEWPRTLRTGATIANTAYWSAVQIEAKTGEGAWAPLKASGIGADGLVPIAQVKDGVKLTIDGVEPWSIHHFRARLIAHASGFPVERAAAISDPELAGSVLVTAGRFQEAGDTDQSAVRALPNDLLTKPALVLPRFLAGSTMPLPGLTLKANERVYLGQLCPEARVTVTSDIRFAFEKASVSGEGMVAEFLVFKQYKGAWLVEPEKFKIEIGKRLGEFRQVKVPPPNDRDRVDFTTPFTVAKVVDAERVLYWEVRSEVRAQGQKGRNLKVIAKKKASQVVTMVNANNGQERKPLPKLERVAPPTTPALFKEPVVYPALYTQGFNEAEAFRKDPVNFRQWDLTPAEPVPHDPGTGPLQALFLSTGEQKYQTDTVYFELPDKRLVWYEHQIFNRPEVWVPPDFAAGQPKPADVPSDATRSAADPTPAPSAPVPATAPR